MWALSEGPLSQVTLNINLQHSKHFHLLFWQTSKVTSKAGFDAWTVLYICKQTGEIMIMFPHCPVGLVSNICLSLRKVSSSPVSWYVVGFCFPCSGQPECVYSAFKRLGTELVLGLFLNVRAEEQPELFQEIMELCTQHWHGRDAQICCIHTDKKHNSCPCLWPK